MAHLIEIFHNEEAAPRHRCSSVDVAARIISEDESLCLSAYINGVPVFTVEDNECEPETIAQIIKIRGNLPR